SKVTPGTGENCLRALATIGPNSWVASHLTSVSASAWSVVLTLRPQAPSAQAGVTGWSSAAPGGGGTWKTPSSRAGFSAWKNASSKEPPGNIAACSVVKSTWDSV